MKKVMLGTFGVILLVVGFAGGWVLLNMDDFPHVDDQDLDLPRLQIPSDQNAFTYFQEAAQALSWPEDEQDSRVKAFYQDKNWDRDFALNLLAKNAKIFLLINQGLAAPHFQIPDYFLEYKDLVDYRRMKGPSYDIFSLIKIGRLLHLRAQVQLQDQKHSAAIKNFLKEFQLGQAIENAQGSVLIHFFIGKAIKRNALQEIYQFTKEANIGKDEFNSLTSILERYQSDPEAWAQMTAAEYLFSKSAVQGLLKEQEERSETWKGWIETFEKDVRWDKNFIPSAYGFHPNRTFTQQVEVYRVISRDGKKPCSKISRPLNNVSNDEVKSIREYMIPNFWGKMLVDMTESNFYKYQMRRCQGDSFHSAIETMVGLKAFKVHHGELPNSLDELVPQYLNAVPLDGFDGKPIRYSKESKLVYSVGDDFKDSRGKAPANSSKWTEPSWPILF